MTAPPEAVAAVRERYPWLPEDALVPVTTALLSALRDTLPMLVRLADLLRPLLRAEARRVHHQYRQRQGRRW